MKYHKLAGWYRFLGLEYGAGHDRIREARDYLKFLYRTEAFALRDEYEPLVSETLRLLGEASKGLLASSPGEIASARLEWARAGEPESDAPGPTVFISYAREDEDWAKILYQDLASAGTSPWLDQLDLLPGVRWRDEIADRISTADFFLALLSEHSINKRGFVQAELKLALDVLKEIAPQTIFILPARVDACQPRDPELRELHWIDLFSDYRHGLERILRAIRRHST